MDEKNLGKNMSSGAKKVEEIERTVGLQDEAVAAAGLAEMEADGVAGVGLAGLEGVGVGGTMAGGIGVAGLQAVGLASLDEAAENAKTTAEKEREAAERRVMEAKRQVKEKESEKEARKRELEELEKKQCAKSEQRKQSGGRGDGKKNKNGNGKKRGDGLGGWIAAVVSLGTVSLILAGVVTVGAVTMSKNNASAAGAYRGTVYEIIHITERVDDGLDTLRISESPAKQAEILTEVLVQTRIAEADLEKLPIDGKDNANLMGFFNHISRFCERTLEKLSKGQPLSKEDKKHVEDLYVTQHAVREVLDELAAKMEDKDVTGMMKGKESGICKALQTIEDATMPKMPERRKMPKDAEGMKPAPSAKMQDRAGIPSSKAEELCRYYFADYNIAETEYGGETLGRGLKAYNFKMETENGVGIFAQISQDDGSLIYFDYYEDCSKHVHDVETAKNMAQEFLTKLGYEDMIPVDVSESGTNADFTFAYYADGCTYYPDEIVVKVCEERGIVSGIDASKYLKNHRGRCEVNAKISMQEAKEKLSSQLTVESSRLVMFEHKGREMTAYEFFCSYDGNLYFVYLDAEDGQELFIVNSAHR